MTQRSRISDRWKIDEFVAKKTPPSLIHDLMQPLNAYGLAAEQLRIRLMNSVTEHPSLLGDLDAMDCIIREMESMLSLLGTFWRLDSLPLQAMLGPTSLEDALNAALNSYKKSHPTLQASITGLDNQWVSSSANLLSTLLACLFDFFAKISGAPISIQVSQLEDDITSITASIKNENSEIKKQSTINIHIANEIAKRLLINLKIFKNFGVEYFSISIPTCHNPQKKSNEYIIKSLEEKRISILDHNNKFSIELKKLLESWGCSVRIIKEISPSKIHRFENAIFLSLEAWNKLSKNSNATDPCLKFAEKIFITFNKSTPLQKTLNPPIGDCYHTFLPIPISPTRLQKILISSFIQTDKK